jgi:tripartite-type tricarboxylate transporter receptor subunit TctC
MLCERKSWLFALAVLVAPVAAQAQTVAEFYRGKTVNVYIGVGVGGEYDIQARLVARHIGKHIPGKPTVVPQNITGAGGLRMVNYLYVVAPKDGLSIGMIANAFPAMQAAGIAGVQFDAAKMQWLGTIAPGVETMAVWHTTGVKTIEDARRREVVAGASARGAITFFYPQMMNELLGTKFKIVTGYPGGNDVSLALERGEVQGRCGWSWSSIKTTRVNWVRDKRIIVLVQMSLSKHPDLPDVPLVMDLAKTDEQRQIFKMIFARQTMGRPYVAPPGVPADRLAALRQAFMDTMTDKEFLDEAEQNKFEINPVSGEQLEALVKEIYQTPPEVVKKAAAMVQ